MLAQYEPWKRFAIITVSVWPMLAIYMIIARYPFPSRELLTMNTWVPFWPWLTPVYFTMLLATWLLPVFIRNTRLFVNCVTANICAYAMVAPWWVLWPTSIKRPELVGNTGERLYHVLVHLDPPTNIAPCAHNIGLMVASWYLGQDRPHWRPALITYLLVSLPSIALVCQHRPIDILVGSVATVVAICAVELARHPHAMPTKKPATACRLRVQEGSGGVMRE